MRRSHRFVPTLLTSLAFTAALVLAGPAPTALAGTINVNTFADEYGTNAASCALREAMHSANTGANFGGCTGAAVGPDTINLPAGTYTLTIGPAGDDDNVSGDLDVASDVTLDPTGVVVIDGTTLDRVLHVQAGGTLTAADLTIKRGKVVSGLGGGINVGNGGVLTLTGVTLTDNETDSAGGAIHSDGTATLRNVTISGNRADDSGGGFRNDGTATLNNVTVAENSADNDANGTGNGGGIYVDEGTLTISNSIVGDNTDKSPGASDKHNDCSGTLTSGGYNLIEDTTGCTIGGTTTGNITGVNPRIDPLADNGGPTFTHALKKNSPAVDAGNPAAPGSGGTACEATDQRGVSRPQGPRCDIGSFEREAPAAGAKCLGVAVTITGTAGPDTLTGTKKGEGIQALGGDDAIAAAGGKDGVCAGDGNDIAKGDTGNDKVTGQAGNDRAIGGGGADLVKGGKGRDRLRGKKQNDILRGGGGNDRLNGGPGFDVCRGGPGRDRFRRCEERSG
jgi:CSLREA domain-containing protein